MFTSPSPLRAVSAITLVLTMACVAWAAPPAPANRVLPLNRFPASRQVQSAPGGFYRMATGIGDDYFDGTSDVQRVQRHMGIARELGVKYLRCAFSWNGIEKAPGVYDWTFWDMLVEQAEKSGIQLIPYVAYTPEWAAASKDQFWKQPPADVNSYGEFMFEVARRYRGRIRSWEIWNEPDLADYWLGSVEQFAALVKEAATQIRRADPEAALVLGGMSHGPGPFFQTLLSQFHIDRYVDVIAMHGYAESWDEARSEEVYEKRAPEMEREIEASGAGADFWLNEIGYADYRFRPNQASVYGISVSYEYEHTANYAADELFKSFVMSLAAQRASLTSWYRIDDFPDSERRLGDDGVNFHLGVVDERGRRKPAYYALRFFNRLFDQPTRRLALSFRHPQHSQAELKVLQKQDGELVIVGWLRASRPGEVADRSGMAADRRKETVSVALPCRSVPGLRFYDVEGHGARPHARFANGALRGIELTGEQVFVAEMGCEVSTQRAQRVAGETTN